MNRMSTASGRAFALLCTVAIAACGTEEDPVEDASTTPDSSVESDGSAAPDTVEVDAPESDTAPEADASTALQWFLTCGDPVCREDGHRDSSLPPCTGETLGDPCDTAEQTCDPIDDCNAYYVCAAEDPRMSEFGCPMSTRTVKTGIHYLTPLERAAVARQTLQIPLASWEYRQHPGVPHLGFIIEDIAPSAAVRAPGDQVDLYGYSSMILATVQAQQAEIEALRAQVDDLTRRLDERPQAEAATAE